MDEFERAMSHRKQLLQQEEETYQTVSEWCESVIHLESSHTRIPALINTDKEMMALLHRLGLGLTGRGEGTVQMCMSFGFDGVGI